MSIHQVVGNPHYNHESLASFHELLESDQRFWKFFKWGFVRHPLDRLVSAYAWKKHQVVSPDDFHGFVKNLSSEWAVQKMVHLRPQWTFLSINGVLQMDFIGRYEHLDRDWSYVLNRLKMKDSTMPKWTEPHPSRDWRTFYDSETEKRARAFYWRDFQLFAYE
jgi:hypothetical protein